MYIPHFPLSFISESKNSSMLCYSSARVLILKSNIVTRQFCSISRRTLLNSLHLSSIPFFSYPINSESSCSYINHPNSATSTSTLFLGLRLDHTMANIQSVHDFTVKDASGNEVDLGKYKGKVLLIVNVASQWGRYSGSLYLYPLKLLFFFLLGSGLTNSNYTELSQLYKTYKDQGLEILAFPCNQFGGQEPGTNEEIKKFACTRFKAEYPIFDKVDVNGDTAAPLYKHLKSSKGGLLGNDIKWNFSKFLVDKDGKVVERYAPTTSPLSIEKDIKKLLGIS